MQKDDNPSKYILIHCQCILLFLNCSWLNNNDFIANETCEQKPLFEGFYVMHAKSEASRYVFRVVKYNKKSFHHLTTFFMST